jgi:L-prolyl-PCP dehydrogenase
LRGWRQLGEIGLFGLPFTAEWGGQAQFLVTTLYVLEGLGCHCRDAGLNFSAVTHMVSTGIPLQGYGSPVLREQYLPKICSGAVVGAHAITEPGGGSDMTDMATTAVRRDNHWILTGTKAFVSNGPIADLVVVWPLRRQPHPQDGSADQWRCLKDP